VKGACDMSEKGQIELCITLGWALSLGYSLC